MNTIKLVLILCFVVGGFQYWKDQQKTGTPHKPASHSTHSEANDEVASPHTSQNELARADSKSNDSDFVSLPPMDGAKPNTVFIFAAENCPKEDAQRANRLATDLQAQGIPVVRSGNANFRFEQADDGARARIHEVMTGKLPIVIVNGRAKANPGLDEVIAQFRDSR